MAVAGGFSLTSSRQGNIYSFSCLPSSPLSVWHPVTCWQQSHCEWQVICLLTVSHLLWHLPAVSDPWINIKTLTTWHRFKGLNNNVLRTQYRHPNKLPLHWSLPCWGLENACWRMWLQQDYLYGWAATLCYSRRRGLISGQGSFEHLCLGCSTGIWAIRNRLV